MKRLLLPVLLTIIPFLVQAHPLNSDNQFQQLYEVPDTYAALVAGPYLISFSTKPAPVGNQCAKNIRTLLLLDKQTGRQLYEYEIGTDNNEWSKQPDLTFDEVHNRLWILAMDSPASGDCRHVTPKLFTLTLSDDQQKPALSDYAWPNWSDFHAPAIPGDIAIRPDGTAGYTVNLLSHAELPVPPDRDIKNGWFCLLDPDKSHDCHSINITSPGHTDTESAQVSLDEPPQAPQNLKEDVLLTKSVMGHIVRKDNFIYTQLIASFSSEEGIQSNDPSNLCWPYFNTIKLLHDDTNQQFVLLVLGCGWTPLLVGIDPDSGQEKWKKDLSHYKLSHPTNMYIKQGYATIIRNADSFTQRRIIKLDSGELINQSNHFLKDICGLPKTQGSAAINSEKQVVYQAVYDNLNSDSTRKISRVLELVTIAGSTATPYDVQLQSSDCQNILLAGSGSADCSGLLFTYTQNYDDNEGSTNCTDSLIAWDLTTRAKLGELPLPQTSVNTLCFTVNSDYPPIKILVDKESDNSVSVYVNYFTSQNCDDNCRCSNTHSNLVKLRYH